MAFWAITLKPGEFHTIPATYAPKRLRITMVKTMHGASSIAFCDVWVSVGGVPRVCFCHINKGGSAAVDLEFEECQDIIFSATGICGVCLFGYYVGPLQPTVVDAAAQTRTNDLRGEEAIVGPISSRPAENCNKIDEEDIVFDTDSENENEAMMATMVNKSNNEDERSDYICGGIASFMNDAQGYCIVKRKGKSSFKVDAGKIRNLTEKKQNNDHKSILKRSKLKNGREEETTKMVNNNSSPSINIFSKSCDNLCHKIVKKNKFLLRRGCSVKRGS